MEQDILTDHWLAHMHGSRFWVTGTVAAVPILYYAVQCIIPIKIFGKRPSKLMYT